MHYICQTIGCKMYDMVVEHKKSSFRVINGKVVEEEKKCIECGFPLLNITSNSKLSDTNIQIGKYTNASREKKAEILKKRSHEHFRKYISEEKAYKIHKATTDFKEAFKN